MGNLEEILILQVQNREGSDRIGKKEPVKLDV